MKKLVYQQGDVLLYKATQAKGIKLDHVTLAEGEATGHHHTVTEGEAVLYDDNGTWYLEILSDEGILTHQEHGAIAVKKGIYEIGIVREYDHFAEEARQVRD